MKARKGSKPSADIATDSTPNFNVVEVEFHTQEATTKRKIKIPHGQFSPPSVVRNRRDNQWFVWCEVWGVYHEVDGAILSDIEVSNVSTK
jgi:hypothetical protein